MDDHERTGAEILVNATLAAIRPTPLRVVRPPVLPSFSLPPVKQNLDLFVPREISHQIVAEVRLVSRNDQQVSGCLHLSSKGLFEAITVEPKWHTSRDKGDARRRGREQGGLLIGKDRESSDFRKTPLRGLLPGKPGGLE